MANGSSVLARPHPEFPERVTAAGREWSRVHTEEVGEPVERNAEDLESIQSFKPKMKRRQGGRMVKW